LSLRAGFGWSSRRELREMISALWAKSREERAVVAALFDHHVVADWNIEVRGVHEAETAAPHGPGLEAESLPGNASALERGAPAPDYVYGTTAALAPG
jgi:hypothetical protein